MIFYLFAVAMYRPGIRSRLRIN